MSFVFYRYYEQISELPRIPEDMMQSYLRDLSTVSNQCTLQISFTCFYFQHQSQLIENTGGFHTESALNEIMRYCIKYKEPVSLTNSCESGMYHFFRFLHNRYQKLYELQIWILKHHYLNLLFIVQCEVLDHNLLHDLYIIFLKLVQSFIVT